ncbi:hypothetical protein NKH49_33145 [Mesorhizobium sp. M1088]|uniref:hypothetical protein n=1 Tax=Mesorhizobium sp. M1088 TaxID=2957056 RepID=UPI003338EF42
MAAHEQHAVEIVRAKEWSVRVTVSGLSGDAARTPYVCSRTSSDTIPAAYVSTSAGIHSAAPTDRGAGSRSDATTAPDRSAETSVDAAWAAN